MNSAYEICKSCGSLITENYCGKCGQRRFQRINRNYILEEFRSIYIASNKGFFYTIKNLLINPGRTAREFINGDRQKHYKPILLTLLLATLSAFISYNLIGLGDTSELVNKEVYGMKYEENSITNQVNAIMKNYYSLLMVGMIPLFSLASWLGFKKWGDNYYEHIVANAFFQSLYTVCSMLLYPIYFFYKTDIKVLMMGSVAIFLMVLPLYLWFMRGFYAGKNFGAVIKRVILTVFLIILFFGFLFIVISVLAGLFVAFFRPDLLESMKPAE